MGYGAVSNIVNYEVYVYQNDAWDLLARYPSEKRAEAIEYAKSTEFSLNRPTKVIRETYDLDTQKFQEALIYLSEYIRVSSLKKKSPVKPFPPLKTEEKEHTASVIEALGRLFFVITVSLAGAGFTATIFMKAVAEIGYLPSELSSHLIFLIFILLFLLISIPMSLKMVPWDVLSGKRRPLDEKTVLPVKESRVKIATNTDSLFGDKAARSMADFLFRIWDKMMGNPPLPAKDDPAADVPVLPEEEAVALSSAGAETAFEPQEQKQESETPPEEKENGAEEVPPETEKVVIPSELEKEYMRLTTLLVVILKYLQQNNTHLDTYARFGISLFMSGACESLAQHGKLTSVQSKTLLCGLLEVMGISLSLAEMFCDKVGEYALEPSYLPVLQGGAKTMELFRENPASPEVPQMIQKTMGKWLNGDDGPDQQGSGIMTIMFTDMVGSTSFTQTVGDTIAQQLIRKHNAIVRQALSTCNGREVKLTGDGTMASFASASNAVDAAIAIQRAIARYNKQEPTVPLEVRIGLNAGEPIIEENDLFGTTVQIAARICALADKDQIFVSNVVKELAAGKSYTFKPLGERALKGVSEPQTVFEVLWEQAQTSPKTPKEAQKAANERKKLEEALPEF